MLGNFALSRTTQIDILLLEMVNGLKRIQENPDISLQILEAYKLNEAQKKSISDAEQMISRAAEVEKAIEETKKLTAELNARLDGIKAKEQEIERTMQELKNKDAKLNKLIREHNLGLQELNQGKQDLQLKELGLSEKEEALNQRLAELTKYEEKLRSAAEQSKAALSIL